MNHETEDLIAICGCRNIQMPGELSDLYLTLSVSNKSAQTWHVLRYLLN